ncbi:MAG: hypothetical protein WDM96_12465 [Lacunisphaera sp.]
MNAPRSTRSLLLLLVIAGPAVFTLTTGNIWEDFFITYRSSLNLLHGHGLVYEVGRRVHTFTSPLGTLLPAGLAGLAGTDDPLRVMALFRLVAVAALGGAWWLAAARLRTGLALAVAALLWAFDAKLAAFSTNGMETALLVLAVVLAWRALLDHRPVLAGVALGALMWTRPDGFIYFGALAAATALLRGDEPWKTKDWLVTAAVAAAIYTPWFAWAWIYYGSPVPNTILAKGGTLANGESLKLLAAYPLRYIFGHSAVHDAFLPPYSVVADWPGWLSWFGRVIALAVAGVAAWPRCPRPARIAALAFVLGGFYLTITTRAPWYFPGWTVLAYLAVAGGVETVFAALQAWPRARWALAGALALVIGVQVGLFAAVTVQLRAQQRIIEWGVRAPLGRSLQLSARSPAETVFLEPLGYIGFYSGLAMRDTPGLCAPEVVALRRQGVLTMPALAAALQTDWVVLRAHEYAGFSPDEKSAFDRNYNLVKVYDVRPQIEAEAWLPGRRFLIYDAYFGVWRRRSREGTP